MVEKVKLTRSVVPNHLRSLFCLRNPILFVVGYIPSSTQNLSDSNTELQRSVSFHNESRSIIIATGLQWVTGQFTVSIGQSESNFESEVHLARCARRKCSELFCIALERIGTKRYTQRGVTDNESGQDFACSVIPPRLCEDPFLCVAAHREDMPQIWELLYQRYSTGRTFTKVALYFGFIANAIHLTIDAKLHRKLGAR